MSQDQKIQLLKNYFSKKPSVVLAFLFGSRQKGLARRISDWDIAVYFKPVEYGELETVKKYSQENKIWSDLIDLLETDDVDLAVLNRAAPSLVYNILSSGLDLSIKNRKLYLDLLCETSYEAIDFGNFVSDFWQIRERAQSLSLEDKKNLLSHLVFLENEFNQITEIKKFSWQDYLNDSFKRKIIERWTENLIMSALDIAKVILASEKKEIPQSYKDILKVFTSLYIDTDLADRFSEFARLRNIVAHEYLDLRWERIKDFVQNVEELYPKFIEKVKEIAKIKI